MLKNVVRFAGAAALVAFAGLALAQLNPPEQGEIRRSEYRLSELQQFTGSGLQILAISPDGSKIAFGTMSGLYLLSGDTSIPSQIPGTTGSIAQPFFSPDAKWVGYWSMSDGILKKVAVGGGVPSPLRGVNFVIGAHWHADNSIAYGMAAGGILDIPSSKGIVNTLVPAGTESSGYPQILPDGKSLLYTAVVSNKAHVAVKPLKTIQERKLLFEGAAGWYLPSGYIIYRSLSNIVFAVPFDLNKLEVTGSPIAVFPGILSQEKAAQYAVAPTGALAYIPDYTGKPGHRALLWISRDGKEEVIPAPTDVYASPRISPDGKRVVLTVRTGDKRDIWVWDFARATMTRLTSGDVDNSGPVWSPDSQRIVYRTGSTGSGFSIYSKAADGSGSVGKLSSIPNRNNLIYWSKDGRELKIQPFQGASSEELPQISPDGRWLAYASDDSGQSEVYVRPFPDVNKGKWLVSVQGGTSPLWSPDGGEIFYRDAESVIAVPVEAGQTFKTGKPTALFWNPEVSPASGQTSTPGWDISPVDKRFLMLKADRPVQKIVVVTNWIDKLKER